MFHWCCGGMAPNLTILLVHFIFQYDFSLGGLILKMGRQPCHQYRFVHLSIKFLCPTPKNETNMNIVDPMKPIIKPEISKFILSQTDII